MKKVLLISLLICICISLLPAVPAVNIGISDGGGNAGTSPGGNNPGSGSGSDTGTGSEGSGGSGSGTSGSSGSSSSGSGSSDSVSARESAENLTNLVMKMADSAEKDTDACLVHVSFFSSGIPAETAGCYTSLSSATSDFQSEPDYKKQENTSTRKTEDLKKRSKLAGDPVYVSTGQYADTSSDISIRYYRDSFDVKRTYTPDSSITGSTGKNWISSLDARLIFGISGITEDYLRQFYETTISETEDNLGRLISAYTSEFGKTADSWSSILTDVTEKLSSLKEQRSSLSKNYKLLDATISIYTGKKPYSILISKINEEIAAYELLKAECSSSDKLIRDYQNILSQQMELYQSYINMTEKDKITTTANSPSLFQGTPDHYRLTGLETIAYIDETGLVHTFTCNTADRSSGAAEAPSGCCWTSDSYSDLVSITKTQDGFTLLKRNGSRILFSHSGLLQRITDAYENYIDFTRNDEFKITAISTSTGRTYSVSYEGPFISAISSDHTGDSVFFSYSDSRLSSVTDCDGDTAHYTYDGGILTGIIKADGSSISFSHDALDADGNLLTTETTDEEGFSEFFEYDLLRNTTLYTDHSGVKTLYVFDDDFNITETHCSNGSVIRCSYDESGNLTEENRNGFITRFLYDSCNRKIQASYSDGSSETWSYDADGNILSYTDRDGITTSYIRNLDGEITYVISGGIRRISRTYGSRGLPETETVYGENPVTTYYSYDEDGNIIKAVTGTRTEEWKWSAPGTLVSYSIDGCTVSEYSENGRIKTCTSMTGLVTSSTYDCRKNIVHVEETDSFTGDKRVTDYEYDSRHNVTAVFRGNGINRELISRFRYDGEGKTEASITYTENGAVVDYYCYFTDAGIPYPSPVSVTTFSVSPDDLSAYSLSDADGFASADLHILSEKADERSMVSYETGFLASGNKKVTSLDSLGNSTVSIYNNDGKLLSVTDAEGIYSKMTYTPAGKVSSITGEYGGILNLSYDASGNLSCITDKNGNYSSMTYYADGSTESITVRKSDGTEETTVNHYNEAGLITGKETAAGKEWYFYDDFGRLTRIISGGSGTEEDAVSYASYTYGIDSRSVTITEGGFYSRTYKLNAWGEPVSVTDGNDNTTHYFRDHLGNIVTVTDPYGNNTYFSYDRTGHQTSITYPDGTWQKFSYDVYGNVTQVTDMNGTVLVQEFDQYGNLISKSGRGLPLTECSYDQRNRLCSIHENGIAVIKYDYSENGTVVLKTDGRGNTTSFLYDAYGNLLSETDRNGCIHDSDNVTSADSVIYHDRNGNITEAINENAHLLYLYDKGGRLVRQTDLASGNEVRYEYDKAGNRISMTDGNRAVLYGYGKMNEPVLITEFIDGDITSSVSISYDSLGRESSRTFRNGVTLSYSYDNSGNVTLIIQRDANGKLIWGEGLFYDADERICATVSSDALITLSSYDDRGRLTDYFETYTPDKEKEIRQELLAYGASDHSLFTPETVYLSTEEYYGLHSLLEQMQSTLGNRLSVLQSMIHTKYAYDGNSNRISETVNGESVTFVYDAGDRLICAGNHTLSYDDSGNLTSDISPEREVGYVYSSDSRMTGSTVVDSKASINLIKTYGYDPLGRRISEDRYDCDSSGSYTFSARETTEYDGLSFDVIRNVISLP